MTYRLYYWPTIQGRGEFVRLALEAAGADYQDMARGKGEGQGVKAMMALMGDKALAHPPFAPPFLVDGEVTIAQTANILFYLGPKLGLAPDAEADRLFAHQLQLTVTDLVVEAHDTHHPIAGDLYYEDQKPEAAQRAKGFREGRIPKYLGYFEDVLVRSDGLRALSAHSYVDLSLFQIMSGLDYAFPQAMRRLRRKLPHLHALAAQVAERPRIAAYLASPRRLAFNEDGIFRHYPELDAAR